jgi:hypothetical protein
MMAESELVELRLPGEAAILVRAERVESLDTGPTDVKLRDALSFSNVSGALRAISTEIHGALQAAKPDVVEVEFGLELGIKGSTLLAVLVDAGGKASLRVRLEWRNDGSTGPGPSPQPDSTPAA